MGSIYIDDVDQKYKDWMGYKEGSGNWTTFSDVLDKCGYYKPQKKQYQPWCATTVNFMFLEASVPESRPNDERKYDAQNYQYQPSNYNYSCGAEEHAMYFKKVGKFFTDQRQAKRGDIIYFWRTVNGKQKIGHVGWVCKVTSGVISTYEGNAGDILQPKWYDIGDTSIAGFGRPYYDGETNPSKQPTKEEDTKEEPKSNKFKVVTQKDPLTLLEGSTVTSAALTSIPKGTTITSDEFRNGTYVNGDNTWFKTTYNGKTGWVAGYYLERQ